LQKQEGVTEQQNSPESEAESRNKPLIRIGGAKEGIYKEDTTRSPR